MLSACAAIGCARSSADYTPQIAVVPGAAARSLWILSKTLREDAEPGEDGDGGEDESVEREAEARDEPQPDADASQGE